MKKTVSLLVGLIVSAGMVVWAQQGAKEDVAKEDVKDAGKELKKAGKATAKAAKKTGSATKKTVKKGVNATADKVEEGASKVKAKTDTK